MALRDLTPQIRSQLELPQGREGAVVAQVEPGGAAARAGIRPGDVILEVNRTVVKNASEAAAALRRAPQADAVFVLVWRQGQEVFVPIAGQ
jgi:serine protease Do